MNYSINSVESISKISLKNNEDVNSSLIIKQKFYDNVELSEVDNKEKNDINQIGMKYRNLEKYISEANSKLEHVDKQIEYYYHEKTNRYAIKVVDKQTKEVICEIPPEKMLDMVAEIWDNIGLFIDEKV